MREGVSQAFEGTAGEALGRAGPSATDDVLALSQFRPKLQV